MEEKNMQDEKKEIDEEYGERGTYGNSSRYQLSFLLLPPLYPGTLSGRAGDPGEGREKDQELRQLHISASSRKL